MEPNERLRYYRTREKLSQEKLAQKCDIPHVTLRRLENNEARLHRHQLESLCEALGVSPFAITRCIEDVRMQTVGDLMGVFVLLLKAEVLVIDGNHNWVGDFATDSVRLKLNPDAEKFFMFNICGRLHNPKECGICIRSKTMIRDLLIWEKTDFQLRQAVAECKKSKNKKLLQRRDDLLDTLEMIELEYQRNRMPLTSDLLLPEI